MNSKDYKAPLVEIVLLETMDVITFSGEFDGEANFDVGIWFS